MWILCELVNYTSMMHFDRFSDRLIAFILYYLFPNMTEANSSEKIFWASLTITDYYTSYPVNYTWPYYKHAELIKNRRGHLFVENRVKRTDKSRTEAKTDGQIKETIDNLNTTVL